MLAGGGFPEKELNVDLKLGGSADKDKTSTLTLPGLGVNSSALYFCAASFHSAVNG